MHSAERGAALSGQLNHVKFTSAETHAGQITCDTEVGIGDVPLSGGVLDTVRVSGF